jgi:hypothetical protein
MSSEDEAPHIAISELSDDELEAELTIAASDPRRSERYDELAAEQKRRRGDAQT